MESNVVMLQNVFVLFDLGSLNLFPPGNRFFPFVDFFNKLQTVKTFGTSKIIFYKKIDTKKFIFLLYTYILQK